MNIGTSKKTVKRNLGKALVLWFIIFSLFPITVVGIFSYFNAYNIHYKDATKALESVSKLRAKSINSYFSRVITDLRHLSEKQSIVELQLNLEREFKSSNKSLSSFVNSSEWTMIVNEESDDLKNYRGIYAYENIFIIDCNGNILFTALDDNSLGTNLFKNESSNTLFAATCKKTLETGQLSFSDYERHAPSNNLISAFITSLIVNKNGDKIGLLAFQISANQIDTIMQSDLNLGKTAESYLVGPDLKMRSNSILKEHRTALRDIVDTDQTRLWREKHIGDTVLDNKEEEVFVYNGPNGKRVLGIHSQIEITEVPFVIIAEIEEAEAFASVNKLRNIIFVLVTTTLILVVFFAIIISRRITKPIRKLSSGIKRFAEGKLHKEIDIEARNEIGELADRFNNMLNGLHQTTEKNEVQDWLKSGQMELSARMSGEQDIGILGSIVINFISEYLNAQIGTIYMVDKDNHLKLIGTHAHTRRKNLANEFTFGEGLVGQAALEKAPILLTNCPEDYICISSGIGNTVPNNIIVFPLLADNVVKGVIELGAIHCFSDNDVVFLKQVSEFLAISIGSITARMKVDTLLKQTQEQAESLQTKQEELKDTNEELEENANALLKSEESLQVQQEELKATNEELEEHMNALQKSEENLQAQQEELRATNEELEARAITLKEQKNTLNEKNRDVEKARKEIEQKAESLVQANKYKSEFLASMSHELRTPLNSLLILAKLLQDNKSNNLTEKQVKFAKTIHQSGTDLLTLINDILDLSKVEAGKMEVNWEAIHLTAYIDNVENTFRHVANEKKLGFSTRISDEAPETIHSDPTRAAQILKNLLSNAFKFTEKGNVSLEIGKPFKDIQFFDKNMTTDNTIAFKVSDTGIGLPDEKQKIIFEAFQQADSSTSRKYGGTGLGLSISLEIARLLGGEIHLESEEGIGSTFTLFLPTYPPGNKVITRNSKDEKVISTNITLDTEVVSSDPVRTIQKEVENIPDDRRELTPGEKSVLMVDDDPRFLKILSELAHEKGFKTLVAGDGHTGLHLADFYHPSAIILDIKMPDLNGFDVMKRLKENPNTHNIPVHFMSAYDKTEEALELGAIGLLTKPVSTEDIEHCFEKIESMIDTSIKSVLIVEDDKAQQKILMALLDEKDVISTAIGTGDEAMKLLKKDKFDCIIIDLGLTGEMTGFELVDKINNDNSIPRQPIIIYTGKEFSSEEEIALKQHSDSIIIKGDSSPERLKDEVSFFLHKVEEKLPEQHKKALKVMYSKEESLDGKKILIVDDDMRNVFALSSVIQDQGMFVIVGKNGREGIEQLEANPDVNIILMDIMMPEMDGYEAMREIRKIDKFKDMPIIALTAKAMKGEKGRCTEAGASDYLSKPVDTERLLSLIRVWVHQK